MLSVTGGIHQPQLALAILVEGELATEFPRARVRLGNNNMWDVIGGI